MAVNFRTLTFVSFLGACGQGGSGGTIPPLDPPPDGGVPATAKQKFLECFPRLTLEFESEGLGISRFTIDSNRLEIRSYDAASNVADFSARLMWASGPDQIDPTAFEKVRARTKGESMDRYGAEFNYGGKYPILATELGFVVALSGAADLDRCDFPELTAEGTAFDSISGDFKDPRPDLPIVGYGADGEADSDLLDEQMRPLNPSNLAGGRVNFGASQEEIDSGEAIGLCEGNCNFTDSAIAPQPSKPQWVRVKVRR